MRARLALLAMALGAALLAAGTARASGLVSVQISPDNGLSGTKISVTADGFQDQHLTSFKPPPYYGEIAVDQTVIATDLPVTVNGADMSISAHGLAVTAPPGEHTIVATVYAREPSGRRYIDDGGHVFRVIDPGPAHPLAVQMRVAVPARSLAGEALRVAVSLRSGAGDPTRVGLSGGIYDASGTYRGPIAFPAGPAGGGNDHIETMRPNQSEEIDSQPFQLPPGRWRLHFNLLVNYVAHDMDRWIEIVGKPEPQPHKLPPTRVAPGGAGPTIHPKP